MAAIAAGAGTVLAALVNVLKMSVLISQTLELEWTSNSFLLKAYYLFLLISKWEGKGER